MIFVDGQGLPFSTSSTSTSSPNQERQDLVYYLLQHPTLISSSDAFKATPLFHLPPPTPRNQNRVYVFQREYATVDPALVQLLATDEATTCVGLVIRNNKSGMTSVSHMDSPHVVDLGLTQMLSLLLHHNLDAELDVHLIGAYDDALLQHNNGMNTSSESNAHLESHSFPLCSKLVEALQRRPEHFHIRTLFVLAHNTRIDSNGISYPIVTGFVVETCTGTIAPANFDRSSRSPDEVIRRIRVTVSSGDPTWNGKLLETYDTKQDRFQIAACSWTPHWLYIAQSLQQLSDSEILLRCSTSPLAEGPDFVDNERRLFGYLIKHPNWKATFPARKPRIFERTADGGWRRC